MVLPADVLDDLNNHDALFITEEGEYERCEAMARCGGMGCTNSN
jgi:hypothetical protein